MACPQDEQLMAPPLWTTSSKRPQPYAWSLTDAVSPCNARRKPRELSPRVGAVEGHGHAQWRPGRRGRRWWRATRGEARAPVSRGRADAQGKTNRRWHEEEEKGRRCSTRKKRRGSICAWHWRLYTWEIYSRCQPPAGSKGPLLPVRITNRE